MKDEADRRGLISKLHHFASGKVTGGVPFTRGRLYHLLSNPVYVGEIRHKAQTYPGQHPAIIDRPTFDAVQERLTANRRGARDRTTSTAPAPLAGKFTDETGDRLTPSHAVRRGKRHRYYISRRLIARSGEADTGGWRLPASTLVDAVVRLITEALTAQTLVINAPPEILQKAHVAARGLATALTGADGSSTLGAIVDAGRIAPSRLTAVLDRAAIAEHLGVPRKHISKNALNLDGDFTLRRRGVEARLMLGDTSSGVDTTLLDNIVQAMPGSNRSRPVNPCRRSPGAIA